MLNHYIVDIGWKPGIAIPLRATRRACMPAMATGIIAPEFH
ncbi:hypothetical protein Q4610_00165 [Sphingobium sp. HBC34]|uniref:Uncharacterized protein n=1 Tax=Sphingobium cyanobacteriorum TaxID=3063954 RepID=A0ABT8ZH03_9SPHN|nr:hypothetical protein [Sphingobium sp. HBC34]MDO7833452.1 hypothetical protein [Sphingobium sp. HBC34]